MASEQTGSPDKYQMPNVGMVNVGALKATGQKVCYCVDKPREYTPRNLQYEITFWVEDHDTDKPDSSRRRREVYLEDIEFRQPFAAGWLELQNSGVIKCPEEARARWKNVLAQSYLRNIGSENAIRVKRTLGIVSNTVKPTSQAPTQQHSERLEGNDAEFMEGIHKLLGVWQASKTKTT